MSRWVKTVIDNRDSGGFVLLILLVFMQIFFLLGIMAFMSAEMTLRSMVGAWKKQLEVLVANHVLQDIKLQGQACVYSVLPAARLALKPTSWWLHNGCSISKDGVNYYYVIENLGTNNLNNQSIEKKYYRVTLMKYAQISHDAKIILRRTIGY